MQSEKKIKKIKKWTRWLWRGAIVLLSSFAISMLWVHFYLNPYLRDWLITNIEKGTKGAYRLEIGDLKLHVWRMSLETRNIKLYSLHPNKNKTLNLDLKAKRVIVKGIAWWKYWSAKKIEVVILEVDTPVLDFYNPNVQNSLQLQEIPNQLQQVISSFTSSLSIHQISLRRASCTIRAQTPAGKVFHKFARLDLTLQDLKINPKITLSNFILQVWDYNHTTVDEAYQLYAKRIYAQMNDSTLTLQHILFAPNNSRQAGKNDIIKADLPYFEAHGIDFFQAFYNQNFLIKKVNIQKPNLYIQTKIAPRIVADKATAPIPFPKDLKTYLRDLPFHVAIDTFALTQARFDFRQPVAHQTHVGFHHAEEANLALYHIRLGRHSTQLDQEATQAFHAESGTPLFAQTFKLSIKNFTHETASGFYRLGIEALHISNEDSLLRIDKAYLKPLLPLAQIAASYPYQTIVSEGEIQHILARKVDFEKMIYAQIFRLSSLHLYAPHYEAYLDGRKPKQEAQKFRNFEQMLRIIPIDIQADTLAIHQAQVTYRASELPTNAAMMQEPCESRHFIKNLDFTVLKINLGHSLEESAIAQIDAKKLQLEATDYRYENAEGTYTLEAGSVQAYAGKSIISIRQLRLTPTAKEATNTQIHLQIPALHGEGIDFVSFMLKQQLAWQKLTIEGAKIDLAIFPKNKLVAQPSTGRQVFDLKIILKNLPTFVHVDTLQLKEASLTLQTHDAQGVVTARHEVKNMDGQILEIGLGEATHYSIDSLPRFWNEQSLAFMLKQYSYEAQGLTYKFGLQNIQKNAYTPHWYIESLSWNSVLDLKVFRKKFSERKWLAEGTLRSILLEVPNLEALIFQKHLAIKEAIIQSPVLNFWIFEATETKPTEEKKAWWQDLQRDLPLNLTIDTLILKKAKVTCLSPQLLTDEMRWTQTTELELSISKLQHIETLSWKNIAIAGQNYVFTQAKNTVNVQKWELALEPLPYFQANDMTFNWESPEGLPNSWLKVEEAQASSPFVEIGKPLKLNSLSLKKGAGELYITSPTSPQYAKITPLPTQTNPFVLLIDTLTTQDVALKVHHKSTSQTHLHTFLLEKGNINQIRWLGQNTLPEVQNFLLKVRDYETHLKQSLYRVKAQSFVWQSNPNTLTISQFSILPTVTGKVLTRLQTYQKELTEIQIQKIIAKKIDVSSFLQNQAIHAESLTLDSLLLTISSDKRLPSISRIRRMPAEKLRAVKIPLQIDTLNLQKTAIFYSEKVARKQDAGELFITDIHAQLFGLRTRPNTGDSLHLAIKGKIMGIGEVDTHIAITLATPDLNAKIVGNIGEMKADFMNQFLEATRHIQIRKGKIQAVHFRVNMQDTLATGELEAGYRHLRLDILSRKKENKKLGFISFLANLFIKNHNNLNKRHHKVGNILYTRQPDESFVRFLIRALAVGIRKTLQ